MLANRLSNTFGRFTGIWIQSHEHQDALDEIARLPRRVVAAGRWDVEQGLSVAGQSTGDAAAAADPLAAIRSLSAPPRTARRSCAAELPPLPAIGEIVQALVRQIALRQAAATFV